MRLSDRVIFALLAVAVVNPANVGQKVPDGYYLSFGGDKLVINEWWGRASDFETLVSTHSMPRVKLDFGDWMDDPP